jgi:hypothetical protein
MATSCLCNIYAEENDSEAFYNYYHRNSDGTFILEQIDVAVIDIDLFSYKVDKEYRNDSVLSTITGYYYKSDDIKFIDTVVDNRVIKSQYFDRSNSLIYTRINSYGANWFMNSVTITQGYNKDSGSETDKIWIFFENDPLGIVYNYRAIRVQESDKPLPGAFFSDIPSGGNRYRWRPMSRYMISEGKVNKNHQLFFAASEITTRTTELLTPSTTIFELYNYDNEGNDYDYMLFAKHRLAYEVKRRVIDDAILKFKRYHDVFGVREDYTELYMQQNGYEVLWSFYGEDIIADIMNIISINDIDITADFGEGVSRYIKKINYIKDDLYIEYYVNQATLDETGDFFIFCSDEHVRFGIDGKILESKLDLNFDIFPDNNIFVGQNPDIKNIMR